MNANGDFDEMCSRLFKVFPSTAPDIVAQEGWGDYGEARDVFSAHGSDWDCETVFEHRSVIEFVNDAAYLFLLPRFTRCSLTDDGLDADVFDYVVFSLLHKSTRYHRLFSPEQRDALIPTLQILFDRASEEFSDPGLVASGMNKILTSLRRQSE